MSWVGPPAARVCWPGVVQFLGKEMIESWQGCVAVAMVGGEHADSTPADWEGYGPNTLHVRMEVVRVSGSGVMS
jgi:hypothetical protein